MIVFLLSGIAASAAEVWPDGSKMEKWFTSEPVRVSGQEARRFVITDYGVVRDSTLLQTAAIQKVIDLAAEKGGRSRRRLWRGADPNTDLGCWWTQIGSWVPGTVKNLAHFPTVP